MKFNNHSAIAGSHAFLSPSYHHWLNYDEEKLERRYLTQQAAQRGTALHELAQQAIELGVKLPRNGETLSLYVNDCISYKMTPEQPLVYSLNCFGTADAVSFRRNKLRIHDLKTGVSKASEYQLYIYAALFCLEYGFRPFDISYDLRIYQSEEVRMYAPEPEEIAHIIDKIITFDRQIEEIKSYE